MDHVLILLIIDIIIINKRPRFRDAGWRLSFKKGGVEY